MLTPYLIGMWKAGDVSSDVQFWWTDDVAVMPEIRSIREEWPLFLRGFMTWYYMFILITWFFIMALERTCASRFILDYEQTSRYHIFWLLFVSQHITVWIMLWFVFLNHINFYLCFLFTVSVNGSAVLVLYLNRRYNMALIKKFERNTKMSIKIYTLPARFQAKENVKAFDLMFRIVVVGFFLIFSGLLCLVFVNYKWLPSCGTLFLFCFENLVHLNPLIVCPVLILSVSQWSNAISHSKIPVLRSMSLRPKTLPGPNISQEQETDLYFTQLNTSWEREIS
ncbi:hypothetical protein GCK72_006681 [Caenorhabditis remanei]|uniref:Uncharacterized protein n=1 Tax=Caenorhabditis remanei TaxID=31234 RepID=A0A6A5HK07_CAERE|nr:hypothetical protein GCK72_006681 [Caenorhabditis remanei]KAF1766723.1 hypothetical protein GCK72_006681 [Caenorhabditis remanei]